MESKILLVGGAGDGTTGADMKVFEIMIHKLRKEFRNRFVTDEDLQEKQDDILKEVAKVRELENDIKENASRLELVKRTADSSVDIKDFRYEINKLSQSVRALGSKIKKADGNIHHDDNADVQSYDPDMYGQSQEKIMALEDNINSIRIQMKTSEEKIKKDIVQLRLNKFDYSNGRQLKENIDKFQVRIEEVDKSVKACVNKMEDEVEALLIERIKPLEEDTKGHGDIILQITQRIQRMEVKIENVNKITAAFKAKNDGLDQEKLRSVESNLKHVAREIDSIKNDITKRVEDIMKSIYFKADKTEVTTLETKILDNLDDLIQSMYKKFSDKTETKENLKILDRQIKNLFDLIVSKEKTIEQNERNNEDDEVMLTRKPLGGVSCASCSKKLNNLCNTQQTEFFSWSKLPFRDPTDRISKVGQGFSKMLSTIKTKAEKSRNFESNVYNKTHLSTSDLRKDIESQDDPKVYESLAPMKSYTPFIKFDVAQRTARERKVKALDKGDEEAAQDDYQSYLPKIMKSTGDIHKEDEN